MKLIFFIAAALFAACGPGASSDDTQVETQNSPPPQSEEPCEAKWIPVTESTQPRYSVELCLGTLKSAGENYLLRVTGDTAVITDAVNGGGCGGASLGYDVTTTTDAMSVKIRPYQETTTASTQKARICPAVLMPAGIRFIFPGLAAGAYTLRLENYQHAERGVLERRVNVLPQGN